jgi:hypothetical protein
MKNFFVISLLIAALFLMAAVPNPSVPTSNYTMPDGEKLSIISHPDIVLGDNTRIHWITLVVIPIGKDSQPEDWVREELVISKNFISISYWDLNNRVDIFQDRAGDFQFKIPRPFDKAEGVLERTPWGMDTSKLGNFVFVIPRPRVTERIVREEAKNFIEPR